MDDRLDRIEQWLKQLAEQMQLELRAMDVRLGKIEARLEQMATKADINEIRAEMQKMNAEIKSWTLATMITIVGTMLAAILGISQIFKTSGPAAPPQPIIIYPQAPPPATTAPVHPSSLEPGVQARIAFNQRPEQLQLFRLDRQ